ncbi:MAG TPA: hypothetical protein IAA19_06025 [Candidatus Olsenella pullistercoris]|uniref:SAF domain-containing protein n=1 Tax=Candidatus Olsenella pullistercoris TaxID=2838712 RepID=A0A9D2EZY2_9ACTN|nr:hypothetical protein [Candidatus Olsenella pullistercoris]
MKRRTRLVVSGALALLAAAACALYGQQVREEAQRVRAEALERYGGEVVRLVVATEGLEPGDVVSRANVAEREWVADLAPQGAVTGIDEVLGSEVTVPAAAGAPLTSLNFRERADAVEVPEGAVAISVALTDDLGLPRSAEAGSVLVAYEVADDGVRLIAGDVEVIEAPVDTGGLMTTGELTIAVAPEDVASVLAAGASGALRLALPSEGATGLPEEQLQAPTEVGSEGATAPEGGEAQ